MHYAKAVMIGLVAMSFAFVVRAEDAAPTKSFVYKVTPQTPLELIVHYPNGWKESDKRPAIVFFFGGGWTNGSVKAFEDQAKHLAARGMVAVRADYRVKSRQPTVTPKDCVEDAKSAMRYVRQNAAKLGIDPDKIVASGGSAGGHIAACTTLTPGLDAPGEDTAVSTKANAMVLFNPVLDFTPATLASRVGNDQAIVEAISPTRHLSKDTVPALMLYGTMDQLKAQGDDYLTKAKEIGVRAEMFTADGQKHGFFNKEPWKTKTIERMDEFLESIGYLEKAK